MLAGVIPRYLVQLYLEKIQRSGNSLLLRLILPHVCVFKTCAGFLIGLDGEAKEERRQPLTSLRTADKDSAQLLRFLMRV